MVNDPLKILVISDIHLGNRRVPADWTTRSIKKLLAETVNIAKIDILVLCGDIFDQALYLPDNCISDIYLWISYILRLCKKHNICLRVLEGTPSHDRGQSKEFITFNELMEIDADVKYVSTLSIEYIERFNINVLYVPDEWSGSVDETKKQVIDLLTESNLTQVDYSFMHGNVSHQLPSFKRSICHDSEFYLGITKKYIFIGHHHDMSQYKRILAQGSIDRIKHGEEGDKGFFFVTAYQDSFCNDKVVFIKNKYAAIFKTVNLANKTHDEAIEILNEHVLTLKKIWDTEKRPIHLNIQYDKDSGLGGLITPYKQCYPFIGWTVKVNAQIDTQSLDAGLIHVTMSKIYDPPALNETSILEIMSNRLNAFGIEPNTISAALEILNKIKN